MDLEKLTDAQLLELEDRAVKVRAAREHALLVKQDLRREEATERGEVARQASLERSVSAVLAAIALLEEERDTLKRREPQARNEERQSLRAAIRQIEDGVAPGEGCEGWVWALLTCPEVARFRLVRPCIASLNRELARLRRGERKVGDPVEIHG